MYPNIDSVKTGARIKELITAAGYDVSSIQDYLCLACPQPVYRWYKGQNMPSVDRLYALSVLLGVHMEDFIVQAEPAGESNLKRLASYYDGLQSAA